MRWMMAGGAIKLDMLFKTFIVSSFSAEERKKWLGLTDPTQLMSTYIYTYTYILQLFYLIFFFNHLLMHNVQMRLEFGIQLVIHVLENCKRNISDSTWVLRAA